ncbi:ATP-binding cassette domain-containing protein [Streptomyces marianii]|uniref:ATP-binding cassette domain-containing protein n=1 Tax=Streptomyces marianii TaxID=1817406 RepID=UPI0014860601
MSLTLRAGEVTGFVGANGAGKTTTIRLMLQLARGEGSTLFLGCPLHAWGSPAKVVGAVLGGVAGQPQAPGALTSEDGGRRLRSAGQPRRRTAREGGLTVAAELRLAQLSLGMAQRVGIAQALLGGPRVLTWTSRRTGSTRTPSADCDSSCGLRRTKDAPCSSPATSWER